MPCRPKNTFLVRKCLRTRLAGVPMTRSLGGSGSESASVPKARRRFGRRTGFCSSTRKHSRGLRSLYEVFRLTGRSVNHRRRQVEMDQETEGILKGIGGATGVGGIVTAFFFGLRAVLKDRYGAQKE